MRAVIVTLESLEELGSLLINVRLIFVRTTGKEVFVVFGLLLRVELILLEAISKLGLPLLVGLVPGKLDVGVSKGPVYFFLEQSIIMIFRHTSR